MIPIIKMYNSSKYKRLIIISIISIFSLGIFAAFLVDNNIKKEREQRISKNKKEDNENFKSLKTGDIIFQTRKRTDTIDNKIAIIDVDIHGYTVLEITDRVQHTSLRSWVKNNGSYTVKRLNNSDSIFTEQNTKIFRKEKQKFIFKPYDDSHCWSDNKIYDSELIWKTYKRALDIELCKLDASSISRKNIDNQENCSNSYYISSTAIFDSKKLLTVIEK
ncbi:YiiX/YebB-like N1pC/P60 family cysteine hydrolase [Flavicella sediminum]|uniref:YiiX/YebB-like N1pC/P60 family cysteine hydrolase n=1 Tax=Flavicella sediminum TaxID=2585141 RepID=UPI00140C332F|nr:YiiX/YebB-like N1pC/P60 family cysteine hydrolase [Flavicella sediminum]